MASYIQRLAALVTAFAAFTTFATPAAGITPGVGPVAPARWSQSLPDWNRSSSPVMADLTGDGSNEIVVGSHDGYLRAYRGNGTPLWTVAAVPGVGAGCKAQTTSSAIGSSPAVADLDGDGRVEVVIGVGTSWTPNQNGSVIVVDGATGATKWRWTGSRDFGNVWIDSPVNDGWCEAVFSTPTLGDVNGDGHTDIVFGGWDQRIWALDRFGQTISGFPFTADDTVWSSPALFDSDNNGAAEIYIGGDSTPLGYFDNLGGVFRALDASSGTVVEMWNKSPSEVIMSSPAIGDIDGDGRAEVIVGAGEFWFLTCANGYPCGPAGGTDHVKVFAWHVDDGSPLPGFPVSTGGTVMASPALGDVDGDGLPEVVVGSYDGYVYAWNGDGSVKWKSLPSWAHLPATRMIGQPVIADLNGDGSQDVAVGSGNGMAFLDGRTGASLDSSLPWSKRAGFAWSFETAPAIGVLDGRRSIVLSGFNTPNRNGFIAAFDLPATSAADDWPMFQRNARRDGSMAASSCDLGGHSGVFCDVPSGSYFEMATLWMVANGITTGVSPSMFGPHVALSRAQMVTFLWREAGSPTTAGPSGFTDVPAGVWYAKAVDWAKAEGITTGTGPTTFSPNNTVTRAQLVTLMWRRAARPAVTTSSGFDDVVSPAWYSAAIDWAKATGVTVGTSPTTFSPHDFVTRAQAATLLHRAAGRP